MTELLTAAQMRSIEQAAIESGAVTGLELMERAGAGVIKEVLNWRPELAMGVHRASVLCGPGNNGGDGYVVARLLQDMGWDVDVHALGAPQTPDAQAMAAQWCGEARPLTCSDWRARPGADLYVDALFGTGLTRAPEGDLLDLLRYLGGSGGDYGFFHPRLVAVDAPSGLCLDSGRVLAGGYVAPGSSPVPLAGLTVTFECPKVGHFLADGPEACGRLAVVDLGLSKWRGIDTMQENKSTVRPPRIHLVDQTAWAAPCPNDDIGHGLHFGKLKGQKFDHGHCLVVSGGLGRPGAARLAARAALRVAAGLVTVAAPPAAVPECAAQLTAIMLREVATSDDLGTLLEDARITSVCIGPGLGLDDHAAQKLARVLDSRKAAVLDADALTLLAEDETLRAKLHKKCILTPHGGEFRRLFPDLADALLHPREILARERDVAQKKGGWGALAGLPKLSDFGHLSGPATSKVDVAMDAAEQLGATVLFKGQDTVVADPGRFAFVHAAVYERSAPWLATAGAGDVLAGLIAGRLAQMPAYPSFAGRDMAWLHVECARAFGPGLIAEDLPEILPQVLRDLGA